MGGRRVRLTTSAPTLEAIDQKMWEPRRLTTIRAFTVYYNFPIHMHKKIGSIKPRYCWWWGVVLDGGGDDDDEDEVKEVVDG
jgi:hypothetical protein